MGIFVLPISSLYLVTCKFDIVGVILIFIEFFFRNFLVEGNIVVLRILVFS